MNNSIVPVENQDVFDKISAYYLHDKPLSVKEKEIAERLELVFSLFLVHRNKKITVTKLLKLQAAKNAPISIAQAYRDLTAAERVFTPIRSYGKETLRLTVIESALSDIKRIERLMNSNTALSARDLSMLISQKDKAELRLMKVSGLDSDHPDMPDWSKIDPAPIVVEMPTEFKKIISKLTSKGVIDVAAFMESQADDAEIIEPND